jgi:hypothetical protein
MRTHGLRNHPLYNRYASIKSRCNTKSDRAYPYYGGRGIKICFEWANDFKLFYDWCLENGYKASLDIDRIDNNGDYEPNNCRFVERKINTRNKRKIQSNNTTGYKGVTKSIKEYKQKEYIYFVANIRVENKRKYLGSFKTSLLAAKSYDDYIMKNQLEHTLNFPREKIKKKVE